MPSRGETVVSNTGPLIALAKVRRLDLLGRLFERVFVHEAVRQEITMATKFPEVAAFCETARGFERAELTEPPDPMLVTELDAGEAAVIALARRSAGCVVLMDERKARRVASVVHGLRVIGTGGLPLRAKHQGLVPAIRPILNEMRRAGYFLSDRLFEGLAREAGE